MREWRGPPFTLCLLALLATAVIGGLTGHEQEAWTALVGAMVMSGIADKLERGSDTRPKDGDAKQGSTRE